MHEAFDDGCSSVASEEEPHVPSKSLARRHWKAFLLMLAVAGALGWLLRDQVSLAVLVENENRLREAIRAHPFRLWSLGFLVYTLVSLFPGTSGKSVLCGWFFGFWPSLLMVVSGLTVAGLAGFSVSRFFLRDALRSRLGARLLLFDQGIERDGAFYLFSLRLMHVPFTLVNYCSGVMKLSAWTFAWTTFLGLIPSTMVFVGIGTTLPGLEILQTKGVGELLSPELTAALLAMGLAPLALRRLLRVVARSVRKGR